MLGGLAGLAGAAVHGTRYGTARDGRALHGWRLHLQLDLKTFAPCRATVTGACNAGAMREHNVLKAQLEGGRCYTGDCAYGGDRGLLDGIVAVDSSYVMRVREDSVFQVIEERELTQAALDAGVVRATRSCGWAGRMRHR